MIYIYQSRPIRLQWEIKRPDGQREPLFRADALRVILFGDNNRRVLAPAKTGANPMELQLPSGLAPGSYTVYAVWIKNLHRRDILTLNGRRIEACVNRAVCYDAFTIVADATKESAALQNKDTSTGALVRLHTETQSFGLDGLDAYELAVLRGLALSEQDWLRGYKYLPADYITGDANADSIANTADLNDVYNLISHGEYGVLRPGDKITDALTKLDVLAVANKRNIETNAKAIHAETTNREQADTTLQANIDLKQDKLSSYIRAFAAAASRVNPGAKYNFLQLVYYLNEKTGVDASNILGIGSGLTLQSTTSGGNTFPLLSISSEITDDIDSLNRTVSQDTVTTTSVSASTLQFMPTPADSGNVSTTIGSTTTLLQMSSALMTRPISLKKGEKIESSLADALIYRWQHYEGTTPQAGDYIDLRGIGSYTASEDMDILIYSPFTDSDTAAAARLTESTYTITKYSHRSRIEALEQENTDLKVVISKLETRLAALEKTATNNDDYVIITDPDQDPTTE